MKLQHFAAPIKEAQKLRDLGKALQRPAPRDTMLEAARKQPPKMTRPVADEADDGMDAAIHTMTQDHKHLHKKLAHHD